MRISRRYTTLPTLRPQKARSEPSGARYAGPPKSRKRSRNVYTHVTRAQPFLCRSSTFVDPLDLRRDGDGSFFASLFSSLPPSPPVKDRNPADLSSGGISSEHVGYRRRSFPKNDLRSVGVEESSLRAIGGRRGGGVGYLAPLRGPISMPREGHPTAVFTAVIHRPSGLGCFLIRTLRVLCNLCTPRNRLS